MKPLRICILTETYYPVVGGGETQSRLLAEALAVRGYSALILTRRSDKLLKKHEQYGAVNVYRLPPTGSGQLKKWGLLFSSFPALVRLNRHYDLIFVSGFRIVGIAAVLASKLFRKRCILKADSQGEMSGAFFDHGLKKFGLSRDWLPIKLFLNLRNMILTKADAFSAISPNITAELTLAGIPSNQIHGIPNSVDTDRFCPATPERKGALREKLGLSQNAIIVIYVGRLVSYKGLPLLLEVWRELCQERKNACLLLVGTGGLDIHNCESDLRSFVEAKDLSGSVRFTGSVENVPEYLQAADVFAFPTQDDALPSSLLEAMACALPVVTTPIGAIKTIVKDGQNGLLIQPGDFHQLYGALNQLMADTNLASQLGQAALKTVQANFSFEVVTKQYLALFDQAIKSSSAALGSPLNLR